MKPLFQITERFHGKGPVIFAWQPDGNFLATAGVNGESRDCLAVAGAAFETVIGGIGDVGAQQRRTTLFGPSPRRQWRPTCCEGPHSPDCVPWADHHWRVSTGDVSHREGPHVTRRWSQWLPRSRGSQLPVRRQPPALVCAHSLSTNAMPCLLHSSNTCRALAACTHIQPSAANSTAPRPQRPERTHTALHRPRSHLRSPWRADRRGAP